MLYNPVTGEYEDVGGSVSLKGQVGLTAMDMAGVDSPLASRMMQHLPGMLPFVGYAGLRGSNTMMYGGFSGAPIRSGADAFMGSSSRRAALATNVNKMPFARGFMANYMPHRMGQVGRYQNIGVFAGYDQQKYTFAKGANFLNRSKRASGYFDARLAGGVADGEKLFGPGVYSAISAGTRVDRLERVAQGAGRAARRAQAKLEKIDANVRAIHSMNHSSAGIVAQANRNFVSTTQTAGVRGNQMVSALHGRGTQYIGGFFRGSMGFGAVGGLSYSAQQGADAARRVVDRSITNLRAEGKLTSFTGTVDDVLEKGALRTLGPKGTAQAMAGKGGAKFAASMGARALALKVPGLNVIAAASLAYDLGKMAGEVVKSGVNLVRDANISMQGSIAKPIFGMGYRDTEAAATSRARGVMAIQNSRLNARSALGAEGAMMAAHYG